VLYSFQQEASVRTIVSVFFLLTATLCYPEFCLSQGQSGKKEEKVSADKLNTTSNRVKDLYQAANASLFATMIEPERYSGPHAGPGFYMGMNGPLVSIAWLEKDKNGEAVVRAKRYIPIGSIISLDRPMDLPSGPNRYIGYYKGPFDEIEFFILVDDKSEDDKESLVNRFTQRWKLYLLSQEPTR
jgi:hypothetical protein